MTSQHPAPLREARGQRHERVKRGLVVATPLSRLCQHTAARPSGSRPRPRRDCAGPWSVPPSEASNRCGGAGANAGHHLCLVLVQRPAGPALGALQLQLQLLALSNLVQGPPLAWLPPKARHKGAAVREIVRDIGRGPPGAAVSAPPAMLAQNPSARAWRVARVVPSLVLGLAKRLVCRQSWTTPASAGSGTGAAMRGVAPSGPQTIGDAVHPWRPSVCLVPWPALT